MCRALQTQKRVPLSKKEQKELRAEQKKKIIQEEHRFRQSKETALEVHFKNSTDIASRNSAIMRALKDGYGQAEIARYWGVSAALVSYVFRTHILRPACLCPNQ